MASNQAGSITYYRGKPENKNAVLSTKGTGHTFNYKPSNKDERDARRRVWDRFREMRDDPIRAEAMKEWELGRKMYRMWAPEREDEDWGADVTLPDGFSAIQSHLQETINAHFRPELDGVESSDEVLAKFNNDIFQHAMNTTEFDAETMKARSASAMMGTAFTREEIRYETRIVMDPTSYENGEIKYTKREIIDFDDVYTRYVRPENCYFDNRAEDQKYGIDCVYREVLDYDTFKDLYMDKPGFSNVEKVVPAGSLTAQAGFFKMAGDMDNNDVEVLHYENRLTDSYDVLCNNVMIRTGPMPNRHKELTLDVWTFYPIEGQIYGMGIPRLIYSLVEERRTNRNQQIDKNTLINEGMYFVNDMYDLDEDDLIPRPHGMVKINTNGLSIRDAVVPVQYTPTPESSYRLDDTLLMDQRRAHGIQDNPAMSPGTTATQAAIIKESTQLRINLVNTLSAWNTLIRLGKKKWSNVQFTYPAARIERTLENNKWHDDTKKYRTVKTPRMSFNVYGDPKAGQPLELKGEEIPGIGRTKLDPTFARFMLDDFDVTMNAAAMAVISKPIKQQQTNEMFDRVTANPIVARFLDGAKAFKRMLVVNDESPSDWMANDGLDEADMKEMAHKENLLFVDMETKGQLFMLPGTPGATMAHTEVHLQFRQTQLYKDLSAPVQKIVDNHILEENENNPQTPNMADVMGGAGGGQPPDPNAPQGGGLAVPNGAPGGPAAGDGQGAVPGAPVAGGDVTAGNAVA